MSINGLQNNQTLLPYTTPPRKMLSLVKPALLDTASVSGDNQGKDPFPIATRLFDFCLDKIYDGTTKGKIIGTAGLGLTGAAYGFAFGAVLGLALGVMCIPAGATLATIVNAQLTLGKIGAGLLGTAGLGFGTYTSIKA